MAFKREGGQAISEQGQSLFINMRAQGICILRPSSVAAFVHKYAVVVHYLSTLLTCARSKGTWHSFDGVQHHAKDIATRLQIVFTAGTKDT